MSPFRDLCRIAAFTLVVRPVLRVVAGFRATGLGNLPAAGPAVIAANHNSHLDGLALMSLYPNRMLARVRPVAAADHFLGPGIVGWLARTFLNLIAIDRSGQGAEAVLGPVREALAAGDIVIVFPEGTRGEPEVMTKFRRGASVLADEFPDVPFVPVCLKGLGHVLPKGARMLCFAPASATVGPARTRRDDPSRPMAEALEADIVAMSASSRPAPLAPTANGE